jgi:hypothetical protein
MGGLISVILCVFAAIAFYGTGHPVLFWLFVALGVLSFWSWGVMHNFATQSAKRRHEQMVRAMRNQGKSDQEIANADAQIISPDVADMDAVPNWLTSIYMLATLSGLILLVWGLVARVR